MMRQEKALAGEKLQIKETSPMVAFNWLNDMRHLVIIDCRSEDQFKLGHIRKSIYSKPDDCKAKIAMALLTQIQYSQPGSKRPTPDLFYGLNGTEDIDGRIFASHFKDDELRRVLIVADDFAQFEKELPLLADGLLEESKIRLSKVGFLKKYKEFAEQYSCLWIPTGVEEKEAALSMSRFPSQLTKNLYLANLTNIMSKECTQLKMLGI